MTTDISVFAGKTVRLADGWRKHNIVAVFAGAEVDGGQATPGDGARMTIVAVLGGVHVTLPEGSRVEVGGFGFFGGREVDVRSRADGPRISLRAFAVLGGIEVREGQRASVGTSAGT